MRARAFVDGGAEVVESARRKLGEGATEVIVCAEAFDDPALLRALHALGRVRLRISVATFDEGLSARLGARAHPREIVRGIARASGAGMHVDVVLPLAEELGPLAGRLHGLARAAPRIARFLFVPLPHGLTALSPEEIARQLADARAVAGELGLELGLDEETRVDTELEAVLAGIKPVMRLSTADDEATFLARYQKFGLVGCAADGVFHNEDGSHSRRLRLVYVAKTLAAAEHARAVEAKTFVPYADLQVRAAEYRDLGLALGYPRCCVEAYVARVVLDPESEMGGKELTEPYVVAKGGWGPSPAWALNHFLFETGNALVPFTPCGYRCPQALEYASRVLERVRASAPLAPPGLERRLAVDLAIDRRGGRAIVVLSGATIVRASPRRAPDGALVHDLDVELANRIVGKTIGEDGRVAIDERYPPIVFRFGSGASSPSP